MECPFDFPDGLFETGVCKGCGETVGVEFEAVGNTVWASWECVECDALFEQIIGFMDPLKEGEEDDDEGPDEETV